MLLYCMALGVPWTAWGGTRVEQDLNAGWRFRLGDFPAAKAPGFDDGQWRTLDVPHDWAFEAGYAEDNPQGASGGYGAGGIGWYRRDFDLPVAWRGRRVRLEFDAVYMNSEVWINGQPLGKRPYGYISFGYDLTPYLRPGRNVVAVRVDNSLEPSARWYHGCGIYAPVRLVVTDEVRVAPSGVHITTPSISGKLAKVHVATEISNASDAASRCELVTTLLDPNGEVVATQRDRVALAQGTTTIEQALNVPKPQRWDVDSPALYTARSEVVLEGDDGDSVETRFGIREIDWKPDTGFWLNGRNVKLKGVCEHLEGGPVGAAWPDELIRWKLELLKSMGCNAIRTSHNPQVPRFYDLCDELGLLVMDEAFDGWGRKATHDYGAQAFDAWWERDLRDFLRRDRNHPSIIIWSMGNETRGSVAADLVRVCHEMDPTRPVTSGHSGSEFMDVYGVNGASERQDFFTKKRPNKAFIATECPHTWQVRDFYRSQTWYRDGYTTSGKGAFPIPDLTPTEIFSYEGLSPEERTNRKQHFNSSYDNATVRITARQSWQLTRDLRWFTGSFRWTGFDYPGEAGYVHGGWPFRAFMGGPLDMAGFPKDLYYFYQSQWTDTPMVHLLPHWTHPKMKPGTKIPVWAYSNAEEVELLVNGESLGRQRPGREWDKMQCEWMVPWRPGTIEAVAYRNGKEVARTARRTAGVPTQLRIESDTTDLAADGKDVAVLTVALADEAGTRNPYGENRVSFYVEGPARLLSIESGSPIDVDPNWNAIDRRAFFGLNRAFLQSTGEGEGDVSVLVAAILGEPGQPTSDQVDIDCRRVALRGNAKADDWQIHYTLDGSRPTLQSPAYARPFAVQLGTTVRAAVFVEGERLFDMQQRFAKDEGLYWGDPEAKPSSGGDQAEDATLVGAEKRSSGAGFNGAGYADFAGGEGHVEWYQENDGDGGPVQLVFRYAVQDPQGGRTMALYVNGEKVKDIRFKNTGDWNKHWQTLTVDARLARGANRIRLATTGEGGVNVDELRVESP
ncbi:glycoside hydrolase family 2 TIM barrel-domain containing protein [Pirellulimonas nuda]|uniref:glycoside hydrolase family 2 TIM barrel-domain containing protein n=1 Tax=Pirellulimonas nuda TaxID=2528009 RepID=UPI001E6536EF|nr:glycoside hydrolase family 2 TIM barrel-domain containing protein [Pirellulimonas nuda]